MAQELRRSPGSKRPIVAWVMVGALAVSLPIGAVVSHAVGEWNDRRILNLDTRMTEVPVFRRDMDAGEMVTKKDISFLETERLEYSSRGNVVTARDLDFVVGSVLHQSAKRNEFVRWWHFVAPPDDPQQPCRISPRVVALLMPLPPYVLSCDMLRVYGRVNILAKLSVDRGPLRTYRVIEGVRVLGIWPQAARDRPGRKGIAGTERADPGDYRTIAVIAIEVPSEISLKLANVLSHRAGDLQVEICSAQVVDGARAARVNPELRSLVARAAPRQEAAPAGQPEP